MRSGVVSAGEKAYRLQPARIRCIEDRHTVAEHVADIEVPAIDHNLHAVGPPTNVAVGNVLDTPANPLRRHGRIFCEARAQAGDYIPEQRFHVFTASHGCHVCGIYSPAYVLASPTSL